MIALIVFTDGRVHCLDRTLRSLSEHLTGSIGRWIVIDDSADWATKSALQLALGDTWELHHAPQRRGFAGTIGYAWDLAADMDIDYVAHWEDDFVLTEPVNLDHLTAVLDQEPRLDQMALLRQSWNRVERAAGGIIQAHPENFTEVRAHDAVWIEHRSFFTTNPSVYHRELCELGWPQVAQSEGIFTHQRLTDPERKFAFWGPLGHGPYVKHIGRERVGTGY